MEQIRPLDIEEKIINTRVSKYKNIQIKDDKKIIFI